MRFINKEILFAALIAALLSGCLTPKHSGLSEGDSAYMATFYVDSFKGDETTPPDLDSWGFPKRRHIILTACLDENANKSAIQNQPFAVGDGESSRIFTTDYSGCLRWHEDHDFDYLAPEKYVYLKRTITAAGIHFGSVTIEFAYDPWQKAGDGIVELRANNIQYNSAPSAMVTNALVSFSSMFDLSSTAGNARLDLKDLKLQFKGLDYKNYKLDRRLNLSVAHQYNLQMSPTVDRRDLSGKTVSETPNVDAQMKVTVLFTNMTDGAPQVGDVLAAAQQVFKLKTAGYLNGDMLVLFPNAAELSGRIQVLLEIEPMIESPSLSPYRASGWVNGVSVDDVSVSLHPDDPNAPGVGASSLFASYEKQRQALSGENLSTIDLLEKYSGLKQVKLESFSSGAASSGALSQADMLKYLDGPFAVSLPATLSSEICHTLYPAEGKSAIGSINGGLSSFFTRLTGLVGLTDGVPLRDGNETALQYCLRSPGAVFRAARRELVESLNSDTPKRVGETTTERLTFSTGTVQTDSNGTSEGSNYNLNASVGLNGSVSLSVSPGLPGIIVGMFSGQKLAGPVGAALDTAKLGAGFSGSASLGKSWYKTYSRSEGTSASTSVSETQSRTVTAVGTSYQVDAMARSCLIVDSNLDPTAKDDQKFQPFFVCSNKTSSKHANETYYLVSENDVPNTAVSDPYDPSENPYKMFVRGTNTYNLFKAAATDPKLILILERQPEIGANLLPDLLDLHVTQDFPGVLSSN